VSALSPSIAAMMARPGTMSKAQNRLDAFAARAARIRR
jgi:hypothetical protein